MSTTAAAPSSRTTIATPPGARPPAARARRLRAAAFVQRQGALVALVAACLFGFARYAAFLTPENLLNVLRQNSMVGFVALGMTAVILTAGIDLSVGSLLAVAGIVAATLSTHGSLVAVAGGIGAATLLGVANGLVIAKGRIQPFVVTLAMMIAARGVALAFTSDRNAKYAGGRNLVGQRARFVTPWGARHRYVVENDGRAHSRIRVDRQAARWCDR